MPTYWKGIVSAIATVLFVFASGAVEVYLPALDQAIGNAGWALIQGALATAGVIAIRNRPPEPPADPAENQTHA